MFLKKKRGGKSKEITVSGGSKHKYYISKEDYSSPTLATESLLLSCIIYANEEKNIPVIYIPNDFIQTQIKH